ncbi:hypothetical protein [Ferruginibacter sp.]
MSKRPLVPYFLQKLDDKLLRNKPATWSTRVHLVIWFSFLFALTVGAFAFLAFFDIKEYSSTGSWATFTGLIAFIGFVFWLIFLLRFNVFKRYGNWYQWDGLKTFLLFFICIGSIVAVCFVPSMVETFRANQKFSTAEIVNDINEINTNAVKLEHDLIPLEWTKDTVKLIDRPATVQVTEAPVADVTYDSVAEIHEKQVYQLIDSAGMSRKMMETDSVIKLKDSIYVFYTSPDLQFVYTYDVAEHSTQKILSSGDIYRKEIMHYSKPADRAALLNRMDALKEKYAADNRYPYYDDESYNINDNYETKIKKKYGLIKVGYGLANITGKKYAWVDSWKEYLRVFYYITLTFTLLVFIFRHSTAKTFFLSLLAAVILSVFTGLMLVMSQGDEVAVLSFMVVYYIVFAITAFTINTATVRTALQGIGLNLFVFMTPFMPLVFVALNEARTRYRYYDYTYLQTEKPHNTALYLFIAEIAGAVILLILLETVFRKLYRKWYAAPEN